MKQYKKPYKTKFGDVTGDICNLEDILIGNYNNSPKNTGYYKYLSVYRNMLKRFTNRRTSQFRNKTNYQIIERTSRHISMIFFDMVLTDLILNNYEFVEPKDRFRLSIGHKTWTDRFITSKFKYNLKTGGLTPTPRIVFDRQIFIKLKRVRYYLSLRSKYNKMLKDEIKNNNHEYQNSEHYDNSKH